MFRSESLRPIGWKERIDFPEWSLRRIQAKIDTGARTSALGAVYYEVEDLPERGRVVHLVLALNRKAPEQRINVTVPVVATVVVRNSSGHRELRPVIETRVRIGPISKPIRLTVTNRSQMRFPVILGRQALANDFCVDVGRSFLLRKKRSQ